MACLAPKTVRPGQFFRALGVFFTAMSMSAARSQLLVQKDDFRRF